MLILALDMGVRTGFCFGSTQKDSVITSGSGTWLLKGAKEPPAIAFSNLLDQLQHIFQTLPVDLVVKEAPINLAGMGAKMASRDTVRVTYGLHACVEGMCRRFGVGFQDIADSTVRKHFTGVGRWGDRKLTKRRVIERCWQLGYFPADVYDEDRADACAVFDWAAATLGRTPPKELAMFPPQAERRRKA